MVKNEGQIEAATGSSVLNTACVAWLLLQLARAVKLLKFRVVGSVIFWLLFSAASSAYLSFLTLK